MPSQHQFSMVPRVSIERSVFDRSHGHKLTFDAGSLVPIFVDEALPGDTFSLRCTSFARFSTPLHPIMDNMYADEELATRIFDEVGSRLLKLYEICSALQPVGALIVNDDWGFKTQTMLDPDSMRRFIFPWHRRIVETIHQNGKFAILHSCGNLSDVIDDIVDDLKFDAKHSYEDIILPVEQAWLQWHERIAVMGGIDMDFLVRSTSGDIRQRCLKMLELTGSKAYALGSGNSIPTYVPIPNYLAMIETINL